MGPLDLYAAAAALLSGGAVLWAVRARRRRGPSRGFGGVYAALLIAGVVGVAFLHGLAAAAVALATGRTTAGLAALAAHLALALVLRRA